MGKGIKIIADSSCDLTNEMKENMNVKSVPLTLQIEDKVYIDDEKLNLEEYLAHMKASKTIPKSSCPSPHNFMESYDCEEEQIFVVTLSNALSGTYDSATLAKTMYLEQKGGKFIHVFNSYSASIGETMIAMKIHELFENNADYSQIIKKTTKYIKDMKTFFMLDNIEHLAKSGRMKSITAKIADVLNIKLILGSTDDGNIRLVKKVRGYKKAFKKFVDTIGEEGNNFEDKVLGIAHCNCFDKALKFKENVMKKYNFKDIVIVEMSGLSSTYADQGGLVIAF